MPLPSRQPKLRDGFVLGWNEDAPRPLRWRRDVHPRHARAVPRPFAVCFEHGLRYLVHREQHDRLLPGLQVRRQWRILRPRDDAMWQHGELSDRQRWRPVLCYRFLRKLDSDLPRSWRDVQRIIDALPQQG